MTKKEYRIPFEYNGNLLDYAHPLDNSLVWKDNFEFKDTLIYTGFGRGRSSIKFYFESKSTNKRYEMFAKDFDELIKNNGVINLEVDGVWTFVKRGQNYGIKFVKNISENSEPLEIFRYSNFSLTHRVDQIDTAIYEGTYFELEIDKDKNEKEVLNKPFKIRITSRIHPNHDVLSYDLIEGDFKNNEIKLLLDSLR